MLLTDRNDDQDPGASCSTRHYRIFLYVDGIYNQHGACPSAEWTGVYRCAAVATMMLNVRSHSQFEGLTMARAPQSGYGCANGLWVWLYLIWTLII